MLTKNNNSNIKENGIHLFKEINPKCNNRIGDNLIDFGEVPFLCRKIRILNNSGIIEENKEKN
tara:strand:+ start:42 stop:230 length:189 start_codon:yes stop_codon:yes gene_type:complete